MAVGIIAEYNPFHNGHLYHLEKVKELVKDEPIILVISGNYTQRGILSTIEKYDKADLALTYGVDLVVELPFQYSTQSSDFFAKGSIEILNHLGCDKIVFGSESNDVEFIIKLANAQLYNKEYGLLVKRELDKGLNYPTAMSNALKEIAGNTVNLSNDLLGLSYVKEIIKNDYKIEPITIKRTNRYDEEKLNEKISSATSIRKAIEDKIEIKDNVPIETLDKLVNINNKKYIELLKYKVLSDKFLDKYQTVDEGIDNKLRKEILESKSLDELIKKVKSKRYTYNKINRMFTHILCSFTKEENNYLKETKYIRVLGFNNKGKKHLNKIKKEIDLPIITNINKENIKLLELELRVDNIYNLITERHDNLYKKKPIIKHY